jgi:ABC-type phosphate/phosphonate transport system substrate-binding protein
MKKSDSDSAMTSNAATEPAKSPKIRIVPSSEKSPEAPGSLAEDQPADPVDRAVEAFLELGVKRLKEHDSKSLF